MIYFIYIIYNINIIQYFNRDTPKTVYTILGVKNK